MFTTGVDPAQGPIRSLARVGAGELHQVGRALVHGLQVHRLGAGGCDGADEEPEFTVGHAVGLGARGRRALVAEFNLVAQALRGIHGADGAGGGRRRGGVGAAGHGDLHGRALSVGHGRVRLHLAHGGADEGGEGRAGVVLVLPFAGGGGLGGLVRAVGRRPGRLQGGQGGHVSVGDAEGDLVGDDVGDQDDLPVVKRGVGCGNVVVRHGILGIEGF